MADGKRRSSPAKKPTSTASATKPVTSPPKAAGNRVDELSDTYIDQRAKDVNALEKIRADLNQHITNAQLLLKQFEKDAGPSKKKNIEKKQKEIADMQRRKNKVDGLFGVATKKTDTMVKSVKLQEVIPKQMEKLQGLSRWPIVMDEIGNLETFYRVNELMIDFNLPPTKKSIQNALQRAFFGLSFNSDGSIDDSRSYCVPDNVNRLVTITMDDKDIGECIEALRRACTELHPNLFDTVFEKADPNDSGRDNLDRLFVITQTPDEMRQDPYYQTNARTRSAVPFICVWMTQKAEIPSTYDHLFGPRFQIA